MLKPLVGTSVPCMVCSLCVVLPAVTLSLHVTYCACSTDSVSLLASATGGTVSCQVMQIRIL